MPLKAVTQAYLDSLTDGLTFGVKWKTPVRVVATEGHTIWGLHVVDGVQLELGDRVLLSNQPDPKNNGVYEACSGPWSRTGDAIDGHDMEGLGVWVREGDAKSGTAWVQTSGSPVIVGFTDLAFACIFSDSPAQAAKSAGVEGLTEEIYDLYHKQRTPAEEARLKELYHEFEKVTGRARPAFAS